MENYINVNTLMETVYENFGEDGVFDYQDLKNIVNDIGILNELDIAPVSSERRQVKLIGKDMVFKNGNMGIKAGDIGSLIQRSSDGKMCRATFPSRDNELEYILIDTQAENLEFID